MITEEVLKRLGEQFGLMLNWSNENAIPYLKELSQRVVQYEKWQSIFWLILGIILIIIGLILTILELTSIVNTDGFFYFIGPILFITGAIILCCQIDDIILCKYLPEKIILRYIKN